MGVQATSIAANLKAVRERILRAAERGGRKPEQITLVAIAKTFSAESIRLAHAAGVRHFGENRVQEWETKQPLLADLDATWHLVGHLQSNKAARAARLFGAIDSLDSVALAQRLDRAMKELCNGGLQPGASSHRQASLLGGQSFSSDKRALSSEGASAPEATRLRVLIEVRLAPEATKSGVNEADLPALLEAVGGLPHLELSGLMCIPPYLDDPAQVRPYFRKLRELRDALAARLGQPLPELSMGMSHDFEVAIEEGATQIRLGTALFGPRESPPREE